MKILFDFVCGQSKRADQHCVRLGNKNSPSRVTLAIDCARPVRLPCSETDESLNEIIEYPTYYHDICFKLVFDTWLSMEAIQLDSVRMFYL